MTLWPERRPRYLFSFEPLGALTHNHLRCINLSMGVLPGQPETPAFDLSAATKPDQALPQLLPDWLLNVEMLGIIAAFDYRQIMLMAELCSLLQTHRRTAQCFWTMPDESVIHLSLRA